MKVILYLNCDKTSFNIQSDCIFLFDLARYIYLKCYRVNQIKGDLKKHGHNYSAKSSEISLTDCTVTLLA